MAQRIEISACNPQQLVQLKKQMDEEVVMLGQSLQQFRVASNKYDDQKSILKNLGEPSNKDQEIMIPLTQCLFIQGKCEDNQNVLMDYGTGYFVERNLKYADEYCDRKIKLLKENSEKVADVISQKKKALEQVNLELQKKMAEYQQAQQQQPAQ